jgi:hypothetical protein
MNVAPPSIGVQRVRGLYEGSSSRVATRELAGTQREIKIEHIEICAHLTVRSRCLWRWETKTHEAR